MTCAVTSTPEGVMSYVTKGFLLGQPGEQLSLLALGVYPDIIATVALSRKAE